MFAYACTLEGKAMEKWNTINELPDYYDFVWVMRKSEDKPVLAYFYKMYNGLFYFQDPYTVGDSEGLSVEHYNDVYLWSELQEPLCPSNSG